MRFALLLAGLLIAPAARADTCGPSFNHGGPDAEAYGAASNYPLGTMRNRADALHIVASFSNFDRLRPGSTVAAGAYVSPLTRDCAPLALSYRFEGHAATIDDYLARHPATGLLIAKGATILFEHYQYARHDSDRFTSQSMAKTITAMLFGIAVNDGKIRSLDDLAQDYVPALQGSAYGETSLRALLSMSSGVTYSEAYDGKDDSAKFGRDLFRKGMPEAAIILRRYATRDAVQGTRFAYAGSETEILGLVLAAATGQHLADYASSRLWSPLGAEADASWSVDRHGQELAFCCFNARLRDWARLGLLLANDGGGIIPASWVKAATSAPSDSFRAPHKATKFYGYGYQTWLLPGPRRMFALLGIHGQAMFVDPVAKLVLVHTAVRLKPSQDTAARELLALWYGLIRDYGSAASAPVNAPTGAATP